MRIVDLLSKESIMLNGTPKTKSEAIEIMEKQEFFILLEIMKIYLKKSNYYTMIIV